MASVQDIINEWRRSQEQANSANQERLDMILGLLEGQGKSAIEGAQRASAERTAAGDQSLMDRGLFNTTILDSQRRREGEGLTREINRINEDVALNKAGVLERVTDRGPDFGALMQLLSQLGQGSGGGGRTYNFAGYNRPDGPINPFGSSASGGGGGGYADTSGGVRSYGRGGLQSGGGGPSYGSSGGSGGSGGGFNPFDTQSIQDLQASAQAAANQMSESDPNLPVIPRTTWFQNPNMRIQGNFVYNANTGQLLGTKGN